jgi:hypothetical protein
LTPKTLHFHTTGPIELVGSDEKLGMNTNLPSNGLKERDIRLYRRREEININITADVMDFLSVDWIRVAEVGFTDRLLCVWQ